MSKFFVIFFGEINVKKNLSMRFLCLLSLFLTSNALATKLYEVNFTNQADYKVYIVDFASQADCKIYFLVLTFG